MCVVEATLKRGKTLPSLLSLTPCPQRKFRKKRKGGGNRGPSDQAACISDDLPKRQLKRLRAPKWLNRKMRPGRFLSKGKEEREKYRFQEKGEKEEGKGMMSIISLSKRSI